MIRLFATDLDGTLVNKKHYHDEIISKAVKNIIDDKKYFVISTGRSMHKNNFVDLDLPDVPYYTICMNGAMIRDPENKIIYEKQVDPKIVRELLELFPDAPLEYVGREESYLHCSKEEYIRGFDQDSMWNKVFNEEDRRKFLMNFQFDQINEFILENPIFKINAHIHDKDISKKLEKYIMKHQELITNAPFNFDYFEITDVSANKGNALIWLVNDLDIPMDEVAVYGDGGNDIEMLSLFEHSYAPENACLLAKKAAKHQIGHCDDYAVSYHILETLELDKLNRKYEITRIDDYESSGFDSECLKEHGCFLINRELKCQFKILDDHSASIKYDKGVPLNRCIEEFRFYAEHITHFYDERHELLRSYPSVELFEIELSAIQPSQFYIDQDKLEKIQSSIHESEEIIIPVLSDGNRFIAMDGHTRCYLAVQRGYKSIRAFLSQDASNYIYDFVNEARKRNIYEPKDMQLVDHKQYEILWNQYCDDYFSER